MDIQEKYHEYLRDVRTTWVTLYYDDLFKMTFSEFSEAIKGEQFNELIPVAMFSECLKVQKWRRMFPDKRGRW